jgi:hypothetical protein
MSNTLNEFLEKVTFDSDWTPSIEDMMEIYSEASKVFIADSLNRGYRDQDKAFLNLLIKKNDVFYWVWNKFVNRRSYAVASLVSFYKNNGSHYSVRLAPENIATIIEIISAAYDAINPNTDDLECQRLRVDLSKILKKPIDFKANYFESHLLKNGSMANFWKSSGMENSTDPEFYSLVWTHLSRGSGYTDQRNEIISASGKATSVPTKIIEDLLVGGHKKNRVQLVRVIIGRIENITNKYRYGNSERSEEDIKSIDYHKSILARFASIEDYDVQRNILPYLTKQDFIFAAPIAAKIGLGTYVERIMKQNSWLSH